MVQSFVRTVRASRRHVQAFLLASSIRIAVLVPCASLAQNLGTTPATGQAVQGQTASQPEGAFLNACGRRHCRRRNHPAVEERAQLAPFGNDRRRPHLRFRHPMPMSAMSKAATAGPVICAELNDIEFNATALGRAASPTISATKACRTGASNARAGAEVAGRTAGP